MILVRLRVLTWVFLLLLVAVDVRLAHLQFVASDFWRSEAAVTRTDGEAVAFRRGALLDRFGRPLAFGEIDQTLEIVYFDFRRETAIGRLHAGSKLRHEVMGRPGVAPRIRDVVARPAEFAAALLDESEASIAPLPRRVRDDYGFYVRSLLELSPDEYRAARARLAPDAGYRGLVEDATAKIAAAVLAQAQALADLAAATGLASGELLALIESKVDDVERRIAEAIESSPTPADARQLLAFRRDYENRRQLLVRGIPYGAVFLVNMRPEQYLGIEVFDVDARRYAQKYEGLSPALIGWVGDTTPEICATTRRHELRLRELDALDPEQIDDETAAEIERLRNLIRHEDYLPDEQFGVAGLEAALEPALRGVRGFKRVTRDRAGVDRELIDQRPSIPGQDVTLALDAELQLAAERVLDRFHHPSAIVLLDPSDGAIRALASYPNPRREEIRRDYAQLAADPDQPLFQRAYRMPGNPPPPGSIFKLIAAAAGLEKGVMSEFTTQVCEQLYPVGNRTMKCLHRHGSIDLKTALAKSCNIFFYKEAAAVGLDEMQDMARRFGYGTPSGFGDPETLGLQGVARSIGEHAYPFQTGHGVGFTLQTAIGHGAVDDITPLQLATLIAPFANGGSRVRPYLVDRIGANPAPRTPPQPLGLKPWTIDVVRRAMQLVAEPGGTVGPTEGIDLRPFKVAGKTGTPQSVENRGGKSVEVDHAWFAGYFPYDRPKLAFAIYAEARTGGGGRTGRPILYDLLTQPESEPYR
jgi:cell division protein FtsI/penicillin-binding protein 2